MRRSVAGLAVTGLLAGCGPTDPVGQGLNPTTSTRSTSSSSTTGPVAGAGVTVSAETRTLGPLAVTVTQPVRTAPPTDASGDAHTWLNHEIRIENTGAQTVFLDDTRLSNEVGTPTKFLVAGHGCGWASGPPGEKVSIACTTEFRMTRIAPHESLTESVGLWRDLPGLAPLTPGDYTTQWTIRWRTTGAFGAGGHDDANTGAIVLTYTVAR